MDVKKLFEEPTLRQITVWARGVLQNKEARDVVVILTNAAWKSEGKYVQAFENYVDLPDRIYVPVRAYGRIADEPIESRYQYENADPEIIVLTEETLVKSTTLGYAGMTGYSSLVEGDTPKTLVVNTKRSPKEIAKFIPKDQLEKIKKIVTVDAFGMAEAVITLDGAEGVYDKSGIGVGISAALVGAVVKATGIVSYDAAINEVANKEAFKNGYDQCVIEEVSSVA
ncbi:MAG: pyruvate ferredoxin oxidoreductase [Clostridia bacterium]|nr:pyruvate ferredoxin oxidoreductase [Clostridia bacterium]